METSECHTVVARETVFFLESKYYSLLSSPISLIYRIRNAGFLFQAPNVSNSVKMSLITTVQKPIHFIHFMKYILQICQCVNYFSSK